MTLRPRGLRARVRVVSVLVASSFTACGTSSVRPAQPPFDVVERTIPELQNAMETGQVTSRQLVERYLARIAAYDQRGPMLNAMISLDEHALDEADGLDRERVRTGPRGPLHGVPIIVKDNYDAVGLSTTAGSIALTEWHPPDDAFQVARLKEAGAVILGKANMHEFAYGVTTVSSLGGQTRNPYDPTRNPGGSSGGTGAAVAANYAAAGMGTDTCGSIRMPSFHHALVGLRGTQGLSSRDGIIPLALTQDMGGPLTKTVTDMAIILDATVGVDPADEVTERSRGHVPESYTTFLTEDGLRGARIGVVDWLLGDAPEDQSVADVIRVALDDLETAGAEVIDIELAEVPNFLQGASLATTEFSPQLADYLRTSGTPVQSLRQILDAGLYHAAVEDRYRRAVAATGLDSPEYLTDEGPARSGSESPCVGCYGRCSMTSDSTPSRIRPCVVPRPTSASPSVGTTARSAPSQVFQRSSSRPGTRRTACRSGSNCWGRRRCRVKVRSDHAACGLSRESAETKTAWNRSSAG